MTKDSIEKDKITAGSETIKIGETHKVSKKTDIAEAISPEISAFFASEPISVSTFFKILKEKRIKRFLPSDEEKSRQLMFENDPNGDRLWLITTQNNCPSPIYYWLWNTIQAYIELQSNGRINAQESDTNKIFSDIVSITKEKNQSIDKNEKKAAFNFFRLGIAWLVEKRALPLSAVVEQAGSLFFNEAGDSDKFARRLVRTGKNSDFKTAAAFWSLANQAVASAQQEARQERIYVAELREQIKRSNEETSNLKIAVEELKSELKNSSDQLIEITKKHNIDRQVWGHTLTDLKASYRVLLIEKLSPFLQDALDALEIEPAEARIALKRLKSALAAINEAVK